MQIDNCLIFNFAFLLSNKNQKIYLQVCVDKQLTISKSIPKAVLKSDTAYPMVWISLVTVSQPFYNRQLQRLFAFSNRWAMQTRNQLRNYLATFEK
jgi:hypothetical protein